MKKIIAFLITIFTLQSFVFAYNTADLTPVDANIYEKTDIATHQIFANYIDKKPTLLNKNGKILAQLPTGKAYNLYSDLGVILSNNNYYFYDINGNLLKTVKSDNVKLMYNSIIILENNVNYLYNTNFEGILKSEYQIYDASPHLEYFVVYNNDKYAVIDKNNNFKIDFREGFLGFVSENNDLIANEGIIDINGEKINGNLGERYNDVYVSYSYDESYYIKYGLKNDAGKVILAEEYYYISYFDNDLVVVQKDGKFGLVNSQGTHITGLIYDQVTQMPSGRFTFNNAILVANDSTYKLIDTKGNVIYNFDNDYYNTYPEISGSYIIFTHYIDNKVVSSIFDINAKKYTVQNVDGKMIFANVQNNLIYLTKNDKTSIVDVNMNEIIGEYDQINSDTINRFLDVFVATDCLEQKGNHETHVNCKANVTIYDVNGKKIAQKAYQKLPELVYGNYDDEIAKDLNIGVISNGEKVLYFDTTKINGWQEETAKPNSAKMFVNSDEIKLESYNINGNTYYKLRDLAYILDDTSAKFSVSYDSTTRNIELVKGATYEAVGGETNAGDNIQKTAKLSASNVYIAQDKADLKAYNINGNNYFKLRDLGENLGFDVSFDEQTFAINIKTN